MAGGAFLVTKEGAPYLARFWPDVGKATVGARVPIVPENSRFKAIYLRVGVFFVVARFSGRRTIHALFRARL